MVNKRGWVTVLVAVLLLGLVGGLGACGGKRKGGGSGSVSGSGN